MATNTTTIPADLRTAFAELDASYAAALERHRMLVEDLADVTGDDAADAGTKVAQSGEDEAELRRLAQRRDQMERALERLAAGTYGICETCTAPIPAERLRLMPGATHCVTCQAKAERRR